MWLFSLLKVADESLILETRSRLGGSPCFDPFVNSAERGGANLMNDGRATIDKVGDASACSKLSSSGLGVAFDVR